MPASLAGSKEASSEIALALGSNQGDRSKLLQFAIDQLTGFIERIRVARILETPAISPIEQPPFLNTALVGVTRLEPVELLAVSKQIEFTAGRRAGPRWGSRPLDIDLLLYGNRVLSLPELTLPHPRLAERLFYLIPLAQIAPDMLVPPSGLTVGKLLQDLGSFADSETMP